MEGLAGLILAISLARADHLGDRGANPRVGADEPDGRGRAAAQLPRGRNRAQQPFPPGHGDLALILAGRTLHRGVGDDDVADQARRARRDHQEVRFSGGHRHLGPVQAQ
eukprot:128339-Lingulodinium_polyedra.AAC.1